MSGRSFRRPASLQRLREEPLDHSHSTSTSPTSRDQPVRRRTRARAIILREVKSSISVDGLRFVILPDRPTAAALVTTAFAAAPQVIPHPSGCPWIAGWWNSSDATTASEGEVSLTVIGWHDADLVSFRQLLRQLRSGAGFCGIVNELRGSYYLIASVAGEICAKGTVSGFRRLFHARLGNVVVASNCSDLLASPAKAKPHIPALASRLLYPATPHPLETLPVWDGITPVSEDSWLKISGGTVTEHRWWRLPSCAAFNRRSKSDAHVRVVARGEFLCSNKAYYECGPVGRPGLYSNLLSGEAHRHVADNVYLRQRRRDRSRSSLGRASVSLFGSVCT